MRYRIETQAISYFPHAPLAQRLKKRVPFSDENWFQKERLRRFRGVATLANPLFIQYLLALVRFNTSGNSQVARDKAPRD
jgi:hypothetical protein